MNDTTLKPTIAPPVFLNILVGGRCMMHCPFCLSWRQEIPELDAGQWEGLFQDLGQWLPGRHLSLSGGEPLLHPEIESVVKSAGNAGLKANLCTCGDQFTVELIEKIATWPLTGITVSIDGFAKTHDRVRGRAGLFEKILGFIDYLKQKNPSLQVVTTTVIFRDNLDELQDFTRMLIEKKQIDQVSFQAVTSQSDPGQAWKHPLQLPLFPDAEKTENFIDWLIGVQGQNDKLKNSKQQLEIWKAYFQNPDDVRKLMKVCNVGNYTLTVTPVGDVRLCDFHKPIGNVTMTNVKDIWQGKQAASMRDKMKRCDRFCNFLINCGFEDFHLRLLDIQEQRTWRNSLD